MMLICILFSKWASNNPITLPVWKLQSNPWASVGSPHSSKESLKSRHSKLQKTKLRDLSARRGRMPNLKPKSRWNKSDCLWMALPREAQFLLYLSSKTKMMMDCISWKGSIWIQEHDHSATAIFKLFKGRWMAVTLIIYHLEGLQSIKGIRYKPFRLQRHH